MSFYGAEAVALRELIGMSSWTKAMSVGLKRRESGVETLLLTLHFEEQRLIGFLPRILQIQGV